MERVQTIQRRTRELMERAVNAINDRLDPMVASIDAGASEDQLRSIRLLQRKSRWQLD